MISGTSAFTLISDSYPYPYKIDTSIFNWPYPYKGLGDYWSCFEHVSDYDLCSYLSPFPRIITNETIFSTIVTLLIALIVASVYIYILRFRKSYDTHKKKVIFRVSNLILLGAVLTSAVFASINFFLSLYPDSRLQFLIFMIVILIGILFFSLLSWIAYDSYVSRKRLSQPQDFSKRIEGFVGSFKKSSEEAKRLTDEISQAIEIREEDIKKRESMISGLEDHLKELTKKEQSQQERYNKIKKANQEAIKEILQDLDQSLEKRDTKSMWVNFMFLFIGAVLSWAVSEIMPVVLHWFIH